jgi:hypothetical protein
LPPSRQTGLIRHKHATRPISSFRRYENGSPFGEPFRLGPRTQYPIIITHIHHFWWISSLRSSRGYGGSGGTADSAVSEIVAKQQLRKHALQPRLSTLLIKRHVFVDNVTFCQIYWGIPVAEAEKSTCAPGKTLYTYGFRQRARYVSAMNPTTGYSAQHIASHCAKALSFRLKI